MKKILAYSDVVSVRPGDTVRFMVSCEDATKFRAEFVRIICGDDDPAGPGYKDEPVDTPAAGDYPGRKQAINAGSYVVIPHDAVFESLTSFSVQAYIYPTLPERGAQAVIAKLSPDGRTGFALMIDHSGSPALELHGGDGGAGTAFDRRGSDRQPMGFSRRKLRRRKRRGDDPPGALGGAVRAAALARSFRAWGAARRQYAVDPWALSRKMSASPMPSTGASIHRACRIAPWIAPKWR